MGREDHGRVARGNSGPARPGNIAGVDIPNIIVACIVETTDGKHLLVRETTGIVEFVGGKVKTGETLFDAMLREIKEEIGPGLIDVGDIKLVEYSATRNVVDGQVLRSWLVFFFSGKYVGKDAGDETLPGNVVLVSRENIEDYRPVIPYDNYMMLTGGLVLWKWYTVPPGFVDHPASENEEAIRYFMDPWHPFEGDRVEDPSNGEKNKKIRLERNR